MTDDSVKDSYPRWDVPKMLGGGVVSEELKAKMNALAEAMKIAEAEKASPNSEESKKADEVVAGANKEVIQALDGSFQKLFDDIKDARETDSRLEGELSAKVLLGHLHKLEKVQRVAEWLSEFCDIMTAYRDAKEWEPLTSALRVESGDLGKKVSKSLFMIF